MMMCSLCAGVAGVTSALECEQSALCALAHSDQIVYDVCAISNDTVLLAYGAAGLRAFSLSKNEVSSRAPAAIRDVYRVAFDSATDTLVLLVRPPDATNCRDNWILVTMRRSASEWIEVQRYDPLLSPASEPEFVLCGTHGIFVERGMNERTLFNVNAYHTLEDWRYSRASLPINGLACAVSESNNMEVAFAFESEVSVWRRNPPQFTRLWGFNVPAPRRLLFYGHKKLLVTHWNSGTRTYDIVSMRESGSPATMNKHPILLPNNARFLVRSWTLAGRKIVLVDQNSNGLFSFLLDYLN